MSGRAEYFISAEDLAGRLGTPGLVLLDVRYQPRPGAQPDEFAAGHLPGAVFVDLPAELASRGGGRAGRYPLPEGERLQSAARRWGIRSDSDVVVYDDRQGLSAARAWWVLTWAGFPRVRVLDGGYGEWTRRGLPVSTETVRPPLGDVVLTEGRLPVLAADGAALLAQAGVLVDARSPRQYEGDASRPGTGHIPGAVNVDSQGSVDERGLLLDEAVLRERFARAGVRRGVAVGAYCGGGVVATHTVLVLASLGIRASLFPGSWSAWTADPDRPVAVGPWPERVEAAPSAT